MTENGTEKANTKSVGYSSASSELVPVSFSTIVRVGVSCKVVSNAKAIMVKIIGTNWYLYNANLTKRGYNLERLKEIVKDEIKEIKKH